VRTLSRIQTFRLAFAAVLALGAGLLIRDRLERAEAFALEQVRLEAYESNRHMHLVFETARTILDRIADHINVTADGSLAIRARLDEVLDQTTGGTSIARGAILQDRNGRIVAAGNPRTGVGLTLATLDFFQTLLKPDARSYELGAPFDSAILGTVVIPIAKAIRDFDGNTAGVISVGIPIAVIQAALAPTIETPDARSRLWRKDGMLLASSLGDKTQIGVFHPSMPLFAAKNGDGGGVFVAHATQDGETHLAAWNDNLIYPFFISTGAHRATLLARDYAETAAIGAATLGLLALLLLVAILVDRERARTAAALADKARALAVKNMFLANMSHEFRTPLNAISGYLQMLKLGLYGPLADRQTAAIGNVALAGEHLSNLTETLLDLSRIEAGNLPIARKPENVAQIVGEAVSLVAPQAGNKNIQLAIDTSPAGLAILGDRLRARQILTNLLSNAIRNGRDGGTVEIRIETANSGHVRVSVLDDGPGFGTAPLDQFFEPFAERDAHLAHPGGVGLGLPLARGLARAQGGDVTLSNRPEGGAAAMLELPKAA
jgi:signal transduction histidine kinase